MDKLSVAREALTKARDQFLYYERSHRAKTDPGQQFDMPGKGREDTLAKAEVNREMAAEMDAALAALAQPAPDGEGGSFFSKWERIIKGGAALTPAPQPAEGAERDVQFEVWEDDMMVASSTDEADARHYFAVYSQDGPVRLVRAETTRTEIEAAAIRGGAE